MRLEMYMGRGRDRKTLVEVGTKIQYDIRRSK